ncbi:MAG TPA: hypothetical protein VGF48_08280 [Thermoanaerobaculia bacterium]
MSKVARGVVVVSVLMSLAAPMEARPTTREEIGRGKRDLVKIVKKWMVQTFGDGLVDPWP